jgi:hypothetical protein
MPFNVTMRLTQVYTSVSVLPAGVTLQAIDGETMMSPTMSHNFYSRNGYTFATSTTFSAGLPIWSAGLSWDDPKFFPLGVFFGLYPDTSTVTDFLTLQLNYSIAVTGTPPDPNPSLIANGIWDCNQGDSANSIASMGMYLDEPSVASQMTDFFNTANATQDGRVMTVTGTVNYVRFGDMGGTSLSTWLSPNFFTTPNSTKKSIDQFGVDIYWFAGDNDADVMENGPNDILQTGATVTKDQLARGSHYGNMIDVYRSWGNGTNGGGSTNIADQTSLAPSRLPHYTWIENNNGNLNSNGTDSPINGALPVTRPINPPEFNWACWSTLIHGARVMAYFAYIHDHGGGQFSTSIISGQSISMFNQAIATNTLILQLAPVLNSPFAKGFATVSPHGYLFPVYEANWLNGGIELCVKWYQGGNVTNQGLALVNGFYIFATTRNSESATNTSATFTVAAGSVAHVVGESRSINIVAGQFTDTFANAWTVHIYQIS